ncbi:TetR/AcrR family transcriptional regulator [Mycolicibacterium sp. ELW1]|jgi:AcrR family transcriptional regulator|uniref:TetR/AcrR family transcriptional regulator n=1 Tax=Mycobacteriaceae TaxID=1762 RepID=UPI0011EBE2B4|nr:TetR/AcrR family transcriptional regulator [Mycobacterium sp. ELW1]QEN13414.1 TetR/AcrR family transcriptional regulator [Mycobacterium sp. ELW1]
MTTATTPSGSTRTDRASLTREAILTAAERLFAEHGVFAVSNRQVSEAAGQGNNAAVGYHFGTKTDLVRAIEHKHAVPVEKLREERIAAMPGTGIGLRDWVECLVLPLTDHLTELGNPTWYARFAAQVMADPAYQKTVTRDALALPALITVVEGINRCLPDVPGHVRMERNIMARNLLMHTCAEYERALAEDSPLPLTNWRTAASGLVDAIVGLWLAPVTRQG